jgi:hypothetical protein
MTRSRGKDRAREAIKLADELVRSSNQLETDRVGRALLDTMLRFEPSLEVLLALAGHLAIGIRNLPPEGEGGAAPCSRRVAEAFHCLILSEVTGVELKDLQGLGNGSTIN